MMRFSGKGLALLLGLAVLAGGLAGCALPAPGGGGAAATATPATDLDQARNTLQAYFDALADKRYADAAKLYGGDYRPLAAYNPDVGADDHRTLLERACTANGFHCLKIKEVIQEETIAPGSFRFVVRFQQADGSVFTTPGPVDRFAFRVTKDNDLFLVQGLPVYTQ